MSNENFIEYTRSSAFRIDLSPRMIDALLDTAKIIDEPHNFNMAPYMALRRRGLISWNGETKGPKLTKAGKLITDLLILAEYVEFDKKAKEA